MKMSRIASCGIIALFAWTASRPVRGEITIPSPAAYFGFQPGADGMLFDYEQLVAYLEKMDAALAQGETPAHRLDAHGKADVYSFYLLRGQYHGTLTH